MKTRTRILAAAAAAVIGSASAGYAYTAQQLADANTLLTKINKDAAIAGLTEAKLKSLLGKAIDGKVGTNDTWGTQAGLTGWDASQLDADEVQALIRAALDANTTGLNDVIVTGAFKADEKRVKNALSRVLGTSAQEAVVQAIVTDALTDANYVPGANKANVYLMAKNVIGAKKAFAAAIGEQIFTDLTFVSGDAQALKDTVLWVIKRDKKNMADSLAVLAVAADDYTNAVLDITEGAVLANKGKVAEVAAIIVAARNSAGAELTSIKSEADTTFGAGKKTVNIATASNVASAVANGAGTTAAMFAAVQSELDGLNADGKKFVREAVAGGTIADPDRAPWAVRGGIQGAYDSQIDDKKGTSAVLSTVAKGVGKALEYAALAARSTPGSSEATSRTDAQGADDAAANVVTAAIHELRINPALDGDGIVEAGKGKSGAAKVVGKIIGEAVKTVLKLDGDPYTAKSQVIGGVGAGATVGGVAQVVNSADSFVGADPSATSSDFNNAMLYQVLFNAGKRLKKDFVSTGEAVDAAVTATLWILNGTGAFTAGTLGEAQTLATNIGAAFVAGGADSATVTAAITAMMTGGGRFADASIDAGDESWGAYGVAAVATPGTPYSFSYSTAGYPVTDISGF
jgi:hypothetical protein